MTGSSIELWTDGSANPNPGQAGCAYLIRYWQLDDNNPTAMPIEQRIEGLQGYRYDTSNRMEMMALILGLKKITENIENKTFQGVNQINVKSDSDYLVKAINGNWIEKWQRNGWMTSNYGNKKSNPVKNKDLWTEIVTSKNKLHSMGVNMTIEWVAGHVGNEFNELCDKLAKTASSSTENQLVDEAFENSRMY